MTFILGLTFLAALADWIAVVRKIRLLELIAKPAVILGLLVWLGFETGFSGPVIWFGVALLFSLSGDVLLMLPRGQIIPGLLAFSLAHLSLIIGLNTTPPPFNFASVIMIALVLYNAVQIFLGLRRGLLRNNQRQMLPAVLLYGLLITVMLISAMNTLIRPEWDTLPAWLVSSGALLFYLSDTLFAWDRFVNPVRLGRLLVMITYHSAQALLVIGAGLHYMA